MLLQTLETVVTFNLIVSLVLIIQVLRHYLFFSTKKPNALKESLARVFLADFLMGLSVVVYNIGDSYTGILVSPIPIELLLKSIQTISVMFALYANYKLFKVFNKIEESGE